MMVDNVKRGIVANTLLEVIRRYANPMNDGTAPTASEALEATKQLAALEEAPIGGLDGYWKAFLLSETTCPVQRTAEVMGLIKE